MSSVTNGADLFGWYDFTDNFQYKVPVKVETESYMNGMIQLNIRSEIYDYFEENVLFVINYRIHQGLNLDPVVKSEFKLNLILLHID